MRGRLGRSTPLRLTAVLIAVFTLSTVVSFGVAYGVIRRSSDAALKTQSVQEFLSYQRMTQSQLVARLLNEAVTIPPRSLILHYRSDRGVLITNAPGLPPLTTGDIVLPKDIPLPNEALANSYLVISGRAGQGDLTLARNREHIAQLWEIFSIVALVSLLPTLLVASAVGFGMARGASRRVERIRAALTDLTQGRHMARVERVAGADDLSQIGAAVNRMAEAQEASLASLRQVSSDIAHDLKTPIQRVSVLLDKLREDHQGGDGLGGDGPGGDGMGGTGPGEDGPGGDGPGGDRMSGDRPVDTLPGGDGLNARQKALVDRARAETGQIVRTFQSLLQIAQLEGGQARAGFRTVDLGPIVGGIVDVYGPSAEETGHVLVWTAPPLPHPVRGERNLLGQVAANLIENALRHTPPGTRIAVSVGGEAGPQQGAVLTVADDGPGIPEGERVPVLRRLYRLERSRTSEGSGLGLSLVAAIAELHGATLSLGDNDPGLRVRIVFPAPGSEP